MRLQDKVAIVTGAASGMGAATARLFAREGAKVIVADMLEAEGQAVADSIRSNSGEARFQRLDVSSETDWDAAVAATLAAYGKIDILINNAGIQHVAPVEEFPPEKWDQILAINLSASFHTIRHALPGMKQRKFGRIIQLASAHALVASPFKSAYVAAKHGIAGLTKTVALEGAEHGVTANAVCPGYVLTPLVEKQIPEQANARGITEDEVIRDVLLAAQPTKRFVTVEEVASLVLFLAGDTAGSITGAIIPIDGGWTCH